jgi:hypothetical protein
VSNLVSQYRSGGGGSWGSPNDVPKPWGSRVAQGISSGGYGQGASNPVGAPGAPGAAGRDPFTGGFNAPRTPGSLAGQAARAAFDGPSQPGYWGSQMAVDPNILSGTRQLVGTQYAPTYAGYGDMITDLQNRIRFNNDTFAQNTQQARVDNFLNLADLEFQKQYNQYQLGNMSQRYGFLDRGIGLANEENSLTNNWLNYQNQLLDQDRGYDQREFGNQNLRIQQRRDQQIADMTATAAAAGNMGGGSNIRQRSQFNEAANRDFADVGIADDRSIATRDRGFEENRYKRAQGDLRLRSQMLGFDGDRLNLDEQKRMFETQGQRYGITGKQYEQALQKELRRLGIEQYGMNSELGQRINQTRLSIAGTSREEQNAWMRMAQAAGGVKRNPVWVQN